MREGASNVLDETSLFVYRKSGSGLDCLGNYGGTLGVGTCIMYLGKVGLVGSTL